MDINELKQQAHKIATEKGFWNDYDIANKLESEEDQKVFRDLFISQKLLLSVSELTESMEAIRKDKFYLGDKELLEELYEQSKSQPNLFQMRFIHHIKDTFEDELADTFIRLAELCEKMGIDIEKYIQMKMVFNSMRPPKHDKNF